MAAVSYTPDPRGLRELAVSPGLQAAVLAAAERGAQFCRSQDPAGRYVVEAERVTAGFNDETRAGAAIIDEGPNSNQRELRNATLRRAVAVIEAAD